MGKSKKAVERRVEPLVLHDGPHSLTDEIGVMGHVTAWVKNKNAVKAKEDREPQVSAGRTMWGCLQCGVYFATQQDLNLHWKAQNGTCKRARNTGLFTSTTHRFI